MTNTRFDFKKFSIRQGSSAMKITTDAVLLGAWIVPPSRGRILDIGAGTGLLSLMIAQKSEAEFLALEPNEQTFKDLTANIKGSPWRNRIKPIQETLESFCAKDEHEKTFDFIITNPPYFTSGSLPKNMALQEARHTVTLSHKHLLDKVSWLLTAEGAFAIILPEDKAETFVFRASQYRLYCNSWTDIIPEEGKKVNRRMMLFERGKRTMQRSSITIRQGNTYSQAYIALTKNYYKSLDAEIL